MTFLDAVGLPKVRFRAAGPKEAMRPRSEIVTEFSLWLEYYALTAVIMGKSQVV